MPGGDPCREHVVYGGIHDLNEAFLEECPIIATRPRMGMGRAEHKMRNPKPRFANRHQLLTGVDPQIHGDKGNALAVDIEHQAAGVNLIVDRRLAIFRSDGNLGRSSSKFAGRAHADKDRLA